jgi:hypothetical protein
VDSSEDRRETKWTVKIAVLAACFCLSLPGSVSVAQQSRAIRVSATIPQPLCQFSEPCARTDANAMTMLVIEGDVIRYLGSRPRVTTAGDVLVILF